MDVDTALGPAINGSGHPRDRISVVALQSSFSQSDRNARASTAR